MKKILCLFIILFSCVVVAQNKSKDCSINWRLTGIDSGCLTDYKFSEKTDVISNTKVKDRIRTSNAYVIAASKDQKCDAIAVATASNNSLLIQEGKERLALNECAKKGCDCGVLIFDGSVRDAQFFQKYNQSNESVATVLASNDRTPDIVNQQKIENERLRAEAELAKTRQKELEDLLKKAEESRTRDQENRPDQSTNKGPVKLRVEVLVIGNKSYPGKQVLINSINDATAISTAFKSMGFSVTELMDARRDQLVNALSKFNEKSALADLSIVYYAGHGGQIGGRNYIIPIDVDFYDLKKIPLEGIDFYLVAENFMQGKTKLLFFDACRDNPITNVAGRSIYKGLAPMKPSEGTLFSFATKDGQVASDGEGKNSPYTAALLEHLKDPNDIKTVLSNVREKVIERTRNQQQPYVYDSLSGGSLILSLIRPK